MRKKQQSDSRRISGQPPRRTLYSYHSSRSRRDGSAAGRGAAMERHNAIRLRVLLRYSPSIIAGIAILASLVYMLGITPNSQIVVAGESRGTTLLRDESAYRQAASELFTRHITNRSKLTVNTTAIAKDMHRQFPELATVSVTLPLAGRRPIVTIEPVTPALVVTAMNGRFVIDTSGRTIMPYDEFEWPDKADLPKVSDESGIAFEIGKTILPKDTVSFITNCLHQLENRGIKVGELILPAIAHELHIPVDGAQYFIKANIAGDARQQMGAFIAVQEKLKREGQLPDEYIDVRVDGRAYYK